MTPKKTRSSTKFVTVVGFIMIMYTLGLVTYGMFNGIVTTAIFPSLVTSLLLTALTFFGINVARITTENTIGMKTAGDVATSPVPAPDETVVQTDSSIASVKTSDLQEIK
jgi:hypothetical protein